VSVLLLLLLLLLVASATGWRARGSQRACGKT
jgi:hypothetical protein